ncbi:hypothetical protein MMC11_000406 [Xylographa trunciseda]|nr:hypothetical protein [Xylographa trunciseda]
MEASFATQGTPVALQILDESLGGGSGGPRRPGNVWTEQAREDVFNRREAGEGWETICPFEHFDVVALKALGACTQILHPGPLSLRPMFAIMILQVTSALAVVAPSTSMDYPNRSRHAMQQQYSMMKKQRAVAEGTWVSNRRGRKRKTTSGERWASVNKQKTEWEEPEEDDDTQDEDFEEPGLGEYGEGEDTEMNYLRTDHADIPRSFRPPLPVRSATDPVFRPQKSKIVTFPNLPNSAGYQQSAHIIRQNVPDPTQTSIDIEGSGFAANPATYPNKRLKHSPNIGDNSEVPGSSSAAVVTFSNLMLDEDEVLDLLERGRQKAQTTSMCYETERSSQRQIFEAAVSRANRRAYDYEERLRDISYEHAETVKFMQRQHTDELQTRKREHEREQKKRGDLFVQKTEALNRVVQSLQKEREDRDKVHAEEIQSLQDELREVARKQTTLPNDTSAAIASLTHLKEQLSSREEQLKLSEQSRNEISQKIQLLRRLQDMTLALISQTKSKYLGLTRTVDELNHDLEDLSMKAIGKAIGKIASDAMEAEDWLLKATKALDDANKALSTFSAKLPQQLGPIPNGTTEQEVRRAETFPNINGSNGGRTLQSTNDTESNGSLGSLGGPNGTTSHDRVDRAGGEIIRDSGVRGSFG